MTFIEMLGPTAVPTLICLIVGLVLLVIEMFLPGIGVAGVSGVIALLAVVIMQLGWPGTPRSGPVCRSRSRTVGPAWPRLWATCRRR